MKKPSPLLRIVSCALLTAIISTTVIAGDEPRGCEAKGFSFSNNELILKPDLDESSQALFFIQNISDETINVMHQGEKNVIVSAVYKTDLNSGNWAAMATNTPSLNFHCTSVNGNEAEMLDCKKLLNVCQFSRAKFASSNMGTYWVSHNKSQNSTVRDAIKKGILLRW